MAFDYLDIRATATRLIANFGSTCTVQHLDGSQSTGVLVLPTRVSSDISIPDVGTVQGTQVVGFINDVANTVCVGDKVTADGLTWRVRESTQYKGSTINVAYRVILDS